MYKHHEESLENLKKYFRDKEEVIALIFGGSVAKGCERPDSDLDAMVVITDEHMRFGPRIMRRWRRYTITAPMRAATLT